MYVYLINKKRGEEGNVRMSRLSMYHIGNGVGIFLTVFFEQFIQKLLKEDRCLVHREGDLTTHMRGEVF